MLSSSLAVKLGLSFIAGVFTLAFAASANQNHVFVWSGGMALLIFLALNVSEDE